MSKELQNKDYLSTLIALKERITQAQYQQSLQELGNLYGSLSQKAFRWELNLKDEGLLMAAELEVEYKKTIKSQFRQWV